MAKMVRTPDEYCWSNYRGNARFGQPRLTTGWENRFPLKLLAAPSKIGRGTSQKEVIPMARQPAKVKIRK
tara:strand:- start:533 stop:742 length:210 start_codon:yes stop_codon:yes gene_type:complete